jgi:multiple sugar transport system permease protein
MKEKFKKRIGNMFFYFLLIFIILSFLLPFYWILTTSLKPHLEIFSMPPKWLFEPTLKNYMDVLGSADFVLYYFNSIFIALTSTILVLTLSFPAAYALARFNIKHKDDIAFWILSCRFTPTVAVAIPLFFLFKELGLYNTYLGVILLHTAINLPLATWLLKEFIRSIPIEIEEASLIDGCSHFISILKITLPLSFTGIMATMALCFIFSWNEFLFVLILTGVETRTLSVLMYNFIGFSEIRWGQMCSAAILASFPVIFFGLSIRKYLIRGLTFGVVKG